MNALRDTALFTDDPADGRIGKSVPYGADLARDQANFIRTEIDEHPGQFNRSVKGGISHGIQSIRAPGILIGEQNGKTVLLHLFPDR